MIKNNDWRMAVKCERVINSCKTYDQFRIAQKYFKLFKRRVKNNVALYMVLACLNEKSLRFP